MSPDFIRTRTADIRLREDGIMHTIFLPGAEETLADAQEGMRIARQIASGRRFPILVDLRPVKSQDREARAYYNDRDAMQSISAIALLVGSRVSTLIANFFLSVTSKDGNKLDSPIRLFTDEAEALDWLKGFRQ